MVAAIIVLSLCDEKCSCWEILPTFKIIDIIEEVGQEPVSSPEEVIAQVGTDSVQRESIQRLLPGQVSDCLFLVSLMWPIISCPNNLHTLHTQCFLFLLFCSCYFEVVERWSGTCAEPRGADTKKASRWGGRSSHFLTHCLFTLYTRFITLW